MAESGTDIKRAITYLEKGEPVAIPTETVYGLAANALNIKAITRIFEIKDRPSFDPLIVHFSDTVSLSRICKSIPDKALTLANAFWPGPLTLIIDKPGIIPDLVTAGLPTVAVRVPDHPLTMELLQNIDYPLAAPSANPFGYISPTTALHVKQQLGDKIHYILDGGPCNIGLESTIVGFEDDVPVIYRMGGTSLEKIESLIGKVHVKPGSSSDPKAPGMLKSHYSPVKKMILGNIEDNIKKYKGKKVGILSFNRYFNAIDKKRQIVLSPSENVDEAAKNLFSGLRNLDAMDVDYILAEEVPDTGLGRAINDRLKRASS